MATRHHKQEITRWTTSQGSFQGYQFGTPEFLKGRWEDIAAQFRTPDGEEVTSSAVVYLPCDVDVGDYIALGDFTEVPDPTTLKGAYRVRQFSKISNLRNITMERKAYL